MVRSWRSAVASGAVAVGLAVGAVPPASAVPTGDYQVDGVLRITAQSIDRRVAIEVYTDIPLHDGGITTHVTGAVDLGDDCPRWPREYACSGMPSRVVFDGGRARARFAVSGDVGSGPTRLVAGERGGSLRSDSYAAAFIGRQGPDHARWDSTDFVLFTLAVRLHDGDDSFRMRGMGGSVTRPNLYGVPRVLLGAGDDTYGSRTTSPTRLTVLGGRGADDLVLAAQQVGRGGPGADVLRRGVRQVGGRGPDVLAGGVGTRLIDAVDGDRDMVTCASARTVVRADRLDEVSASCAHVLR